MKRVLVLWVMAAPLFSPTGAAGAAATGLVEPEWEAVLSSVVLARVEAIEVEAGEAVEQGAVLVRLDRAMEELDAARRGLVAESRVELELAETKLEILRSAFEGTRDLYERSRSLSREEYDAARLELQLAEAEFRQLGQREEIERLELELAREQVARRILRAPRDAVVVEIFPRVGEVCEPRQPVLRLVDARRVRLTLELDALETPDLALGQRVPVVIEAPGGALEVEGEVDFVSPVVDGASGLRRVRVTMDNGDGAILPGLRATVLFPSAAERGTS
ncbi:MAG: efflux RND transporter periplasmic adaptor subunit [Opitutales bacterium]